MDHENLIEPEFKAIDWLEDFPIEQYAPDPSKPFSIELSLIIGAKGLPGEDVFFVDVSNALFLACQARDLGPQLVVSTILVEEFSVAEVERIVRDFCKKCRGKTWHEVALLLMRLARWEYEGMETPHRSMQ
jgi:hypothetical protein